MKRNYRKVSKISAKKIIKAKGRYKNKVNNHNYRNNKSKTMNRTMSVMR